MLSEKIKEYLCSGNYEKFGLSTDEMAKDIAEICEAEDTYWKQEFKRVANNYEKIFIENADLKDKYKIICKEFNEADERVTLQKAIIEKQVRDMHQFVDNTSDKISKLQKENAEYQKGMIADAKIIKEADNKIIKLEKEIAELKAKCNLCYEAGASKAYKAITELMVDNTKVSEENRILKVKAVARNGRIMDLEIQVKDLTEVNEDLDTRLESYSKVIKSLEDSLRLAIKPIDKDKIIKILWKYLCTLSYLSDERIMEIINRIADEILEVK